MSYFGNICRGRRVLVTGHTGFKGSWLTTWLLKLGATVIGASKDVPTQPAMFEDLVEIIRGTCIQPGSD